MKFNKNNWSMTRSFLCVLAFIVSAATFGQPPAPPPLLANPAMPMPSEQQPETIQVIAVEGKDTGGQTLAIDESIKGMKVLLERLGHDTFTEVNRAEAQAPYGEETAVAVGAGYSLRAMPISKDEQNAVQLRLEVVRQSDGVAAISGEGKAVRNKPLVFRGLQGPTGGELTLVVNLVSNQQGQQNQSDQQEQQDQKPEDQQNQSGPKSESEEQPQPDEQQDQQQELSEQEQKEKPEQGEGEQQEGENQTQMAELSEGEESDEEQAEKMENVDALLQSLEEIDKREQQQAHNQRGRVTLQGDWW